MFQHFHHGLSDIILSEFGLWIWLAVVRMNFQFIVSLANRFRASFVPSIWKHIIKYKASFTVWSFTVSLMLYVWSLSWLQITFWRSFLLYWFFVACRTPWSIGWIREAVFGGRNRQVTEPPRLLSSSGWAEQLSINSRAFGERMFCERWWLFTAGTKSFLNHSATISKVIQAFLWDLWITASLARRIHVNMLKASRLRRFPQKNGF